MISYQIIGVIKHANNAVSARTQVANSDPPCKKSTGWQRLEVPDGVVARLVEQRHRLEGAEKCPKCGNFNLELNILLKEIDKLSKIQYPNRKDASQTRLRMTS